jgi:hypothetical protein
MINANRTKSIHPLSIMLPDWVGSVAGALSSLERIVRVGCPIFYQGAVSAIFGRFSRFFNEVNTVTGMV